MTAPALPHGFTRILASRADAECYARILLRWRDARRAVEAAPSRQARRRAERDVADVEDELTTEARRLAAVGRSLN